MNRHARTLYLAIAVVFWITACKTRPQPSIEVQTNEATRRDVSGRLAPPDAQGAESEREVGFREPRTAPGMSAPQEGVAAEQKTQGSKPAAELLVSFDGLGVGFEGPQGSGRSNNPSDNSLAVGPDHIVQTVNSRMAIFTKKGKKYDTTGKALYGSVPTNNVFKGFGGTCEARNNGDAVVRYDQLADRWLIVMPIFGRMPPRADQPSPKKPEDGADVQVIGVAGQPGAAAELYQPPPPPPADTTQPQRGRGAGPGRGAAAGTAGRVLDVLCDQHGTRPVRAVLPLRVPARAVPGLPAPRDLAGWLLQPLEHRRQSDIAHYRNGETRLRRRARQDAEGPTCK
jgi:hypothetical protein